MIDRHGLAILDQLFTTYTSDFKEQALKRIIVDHEPANQVSFDLKKKDKDRDNREIMAEIKAIYEEHKHRYGSRCITVELDGAAY